MPPPSLSWTRSDLHALVDALHLSQADWKHLTSLLPSRPPSSIRARLLAMLLPSSPAAKTWHSQRVARAALALHIARPVSPLPSLPLPPPNPAKRRRGRVVVRVTPATKDAAAAVRDRGHNPCVEVVLRGVRPLWDVLKHLYGKWTLPLSLHDSNGIQLTHLTHQVFCLVHPDRPKDPLVLTFRLMHTKVDWRYVGPVHAEDNPAHNKNQTQKLSEFDPFASPALPAKKKAPHPAPRAPAALASKPIFAPKQPHLDAEQKPNHPVAFDSFASPASNQVAPRVPSRVGSPHGKRIAVASSLDIDTFALFASPLPSLKGKQPPRKPSLASTGSSKRVSAPAPLEPSFDPFATPDRARSSSRSRKRVWNLFDSPGPHFSSPPAPPSKSAKRARVPWADFDASGSAGQFATPTSSRQLPPLPESLDGFSNSAAPASVAQNAAKKQRTELVDLDIQALEQHGTLGATTIGTTPSVSATKEMDVPPIPTLLEPSELGLMSPPPSGEKAVMKRLRRHLQYLEGSGCEDSKSGNKQRSQEENIVLRLGASCSGTAIPEAFLKSQSGLDMALVAKLSDSMLSIGQSEGSVPATQPGSRASVEGSVALEDGNASDGFGFRETSPTGPPGPFQGPDSSPPAANRSFGLGDVSLGLGSRPFGNEVVLDSHGGLNQSLSLSGLFREIT